MFLIRALHGGYKLLISPLLAWIGGPGSGCRFEPSCSDYMLQAMERHGLCRGAWLGVKRLARCQPWGGMGVDPVLPAAPETRSSKLEARNKRQKEGMETIETAACACHSSEAPRSAKSFRVSSFELRASR